MVPIDLIPTLVSVSDEIACLKRYMPGPSG